MYRMKRGIIATALLLFIATPSMAAESEVGTFFQDAFYGGLSGAFLGTALLAFAKQPGKHLDLVGYGAAGGVVVGAAYGAVSITRSLAELDHGEVKFAMPTIMPSLKEGPKGTSSLVMTAQLFRGKF